MCDMCECSVNPDRTHAAVHGLHLAADQGVPRLVRVVTAVPAENVRGSRVQRTCVVAARVARVLRLPTMMQINHDVDDAGGLMMVVAMSNCLLQTAASDS